MRPPPYLRRRRGCLQGAFRYFADLVAAEADVSRQEDAAKVACAHPHTALRKYLNADFARSGGAAAAFLKKFKWTTEDQNQVSLMIADRKLTPAEAAKKWVDGHRSTWKAWLP